MARAGAPLTPHRATRPSWSVSPTPGQHGLGCLPQFPLPVPAEETQPLRGPLYERSDSLQKGDRPPPMARGHVWGKGSFCVRPLCASRGPSYTRTCHFPGAGPLGFPPQLLVKQLSRGAQSSTRGTETEGSRRSIRGFPASLGRGLVSGCRPPLLSSFFRGRLRWGAVFRDVL